MEYTYATLAVMAGSLAAAWWQGAVRERAFWIALALFALVTLVADVVLTAIPVYAYAERFRSGLDVHRMPLAATSATASPWPASRSSSGGRWGTAREAAAGGRRRRRARRARGGAAAAGARARGDRRRAGLAPGGRAGRIVERGYTWDTGRA